jgi:hypothetical protein
MDVIEERSSRIPAPVLLNNLSVNKSLELFLNFYVKESLRRVPYIGIVVHV